MQCHTGLFHTLGRYFGRTQHDIIYQALNQYFVTVRPYNQTKICTYSYLCARTLSNFIFNNKNILLNTKNLPQCKSNLAITVSNTPHSINAHRSFTRHTYLQKKKTAHADSSSDGESDDEYAEAEFEEDYTAPLNYKTKEIMVKSLRADSILANSLNVSRSSMEEAFYGGKIQVNGETLLKKAKKCEVEDYIDLVTYSGDYCKVKRVRILKILKEKTSTDRQRVVVRVWKSAFKIEQNK